MNEQMSPCTPVEVLSVTVAKIGDKPVALLAVRLTPNSSFIVDTLAITREQADRLRQDLNRVLDNPDSWMFTPPPTQLTFDHLAWFWEHGE